MDLRQGVERRHGERGEVPREPQPEGEACSASRLVRAKTHDRGQRQGRGQLRTRDREENAQEAEGSARLVPGGQECLEEAVVGRILRESEEQRESERRHQGPGALAPLDLSGRRAKKRHQPASGREAARHRGGDAEDRGEHPERRHGAEQDREAPAGEDGRRHGRAAHREQREHEERRHGERVKDEGERERRDPGLEGKPEPRRDQVEVARGGAGPGGDQVDGHVADCGDEHERPERHEPAKEDTIAQRAQGQGDGRDGDVGQEPRQRDGSNERDERPRVRSLRGEQIDENGARDQEPQPQAEKPRGDAPRGGHPSGGSWPGGGRGARRRGGHAGWRRSRTTRAGAPATMA